MVFPKIITLLLYLSAKSISAQNVSFWTQLTRECRDPSIGCLENSIYNYLDDYLNSTDVEVNTYVKLTKNNASYDEVEARSRLQALQDKATKFMFTHDLVLALPDFLVGGAVVKITPRAANNSGVVLKMKMEGNKDSGFGNPRIFKKIKKFFSNKLLMALLSIVVVIKLLAMKLMFFLPTIMGVAAAKKLLLKVLLFIFPVLSHLFKLCPYYKPTKYHHHHHQISHLHHLGHGGSGGLPYLHSGHDIELDHPPPGWNEQQHHEELNYYTDGPSFTAEFSTHRKKYDLGKQDVLKESGQGQLGVGQRVQETKPNKIKTGPLTSTEIENMVLKAEKEAILKARLQEEQKRVEVENKRLQDQIKSALKIQEKLKIQSLVAKQTSKIAQAYQPSIIQQPYMQPQIVHALPATQIQTPHYVTQPIVQPIPQTQAIYHQQHGPRTESPVTPVYHTTRSAPVYDGFYSPILEKIDKILVELTFYDEPCRERLICSMYKNPTKFSPHSNLISAELSRDASELQKPTSSNAAVIRFYKYVQAARDGQDKRDCLRLYPSCSIVTE